MKRVCVLGAFIGAVLTQPALAQDSKIHGFVAAGAVVGNDYEGSETYEIGPAVAARFQYRHLYLQTEGLGAKVNVSPLEGFEFGPRVNYRSGRDDDVENDAVSRMAEIDDAFEGGAFARLQRTSIFDSNDEIAFEISALTDLSGTHEGLLVTFGPEYGFQASRKLRLTVGLEGTYADDEYMDTYFGVNPGNLGTSGLSNFRAEGGLKDVGISLMAGYQFNESWGAVGIAGFNRLLGDAADSPLVAQEGSASQFTALLGVSYRF